MTSLDEEIIVDVDLNKTIPCDSKECSNEAEWLMIRKCCGHREMKCTFHKEETCKLIKNVALITCFLCGVSRLGPKVSSCYRYIGRL
jgi:hypothetical protein